MDRVFYLFDEIGICYKNVIICLSFFFVRLLGNGIYFVGKYNYRRLKGVLIC